jgi:hypothetical protein
MLEQPELELDIDLTGMLVHYDEAHLVDPAKYRLSWRPDNYARVSRREVDTTGMIRCCRAGTCQVAESCAFGRPHKAKAMDAVPGVCYDHQPYVIGGVQVWAEVIGGACDAD